MMKTGKGALLAAAAGIVALGLLAGHCAPSAPKGAKKGAAVSDTAPPFLPPLGAAVSDTASAAMKTYIAPGDLDEYYLFSSGGHSGQVYVYGVPSMRHLSTIPVFTPYPGVGYGFDDDTRKMLGDLTWGDAHHPALSETAGDYDGRWLFVNEMNGRVARIDLRDFKTKQIIGPVPNISGNHGSTFITPNSDYVLMSSRFSIPIPKGKAVSIEKYASEYKGMAAGIKIDPKTGMVVNLFDLKRVMLDVIEEFDHKNLNLDMPYFKDQIPTSENFARLLWEKLSLQRDIGALHTVRLCEDEDLYAEVTAAKGLDVASVTRRYSFTAVQDGNQGHTWDLFVTVHGRIDPVTGMVTDIGVLDRLVHDQIVQPFDRKDLRHVLSVPTISGELLTKAIWARLANRVLGGTLRHIRLEQTRDLSFDYAG